MLTVTESDKLSVLLDSRPGLLEVFGLENFTQSDLRDILAISQTEARNIIITLVRLRALKRGTQFYSLSSDALEYVQERIYNI